MRWWGLEDEVVGVVEAQVGSEIFETWWWWWSSWGGGGGCQPFLGKQKNSGTKSLMALSEFAPPPKKKKKKKKEKKRKRKEEKK